MSAGSGQFKVKLSDNRHGVNKTVANPSFSSSKVSADKNPLQGIALRCNLSNWLDWVDSMGAQNVSLIGFYLGNARSKNNITITDEEREFILKELFLDAVNNGALHFTAKVNPKDFSFKLKRRALSDIDLIMEYAPKGAVNVTGETYFYDDYLGSNYKTGTVINILLLFQSAFLSAGGSY